MTNTSIFQKNITLFARFNAEIARHITSIPLTPPEKYAANSAEWFAELKLNGIFTLFVHNISPHGEEFIPLKSWVEQNPMHTVVFLVDDLPLVRTFFESSTASDLLQHSQFVFHIFDWSSFNDLNKMRQEFDWMCRAFSIVKTLFSSKIGANEHQKKQLTLLKNTLQKEFDEHLSTYHNYLEVQKTVMYSFYPNLLELTNAYFGSSMKGIFSGIPAIICGAGPSLEQELSLLKTLHNKALLFGAGSALNILSRHGILPHFAGGVDPYDTQKSRLSTNFAFQVPFFYVNRFNHAALQFVQGDKLYLRGGTRLHMAEWFDTKLGLDAGQPIPSGKSTTNFCLEAAGMLGCNPIILLGTDLCYQSKRYAAGVTAHPLDDTKHHEDISRLKGKIITTHEGKECTTSRNWLLEAEAFTDFCSRNPTVKILNATQGGLPIPNIPSISFSAAEKNFFHVTFDFEALIHNAIQSNPLSLSKDQLKSVLTTWESALNECNTVIAAYLRKASFGLGVLTDLLKAKEPYAAFLEQYNAIFDSLNSRDYFRLIHFPEACPPWMQKEMTERLEIERARFLLDKINFHLQRTKETLALLPDYIELPKSVSSQQKKELIEIITDPSTGDVLKKFSYSTGELYAIKNYREDRLLGKQEFFYKDGTTRSVLQYYDGLLSGQVLLFYPGGKIKRELHFLNGELHGAEREWNEQGLLIREAEYRENAPIGVSRAWDSNGVLTREVTHAECGGNAKIKK